MRKEVVSLWVLGVLVYFVMVARFTLYDLMVACTVSLIAAVVAGKGVVEKPSKLFSIKRWFYAIAYMVYYLFIVEPRCHLRVASMILGLRDYYPGIVEVSYDYETDYAVTAVANSITNTPGTVVVDLDTSRKTYLVHWLEAYRREPRVVWEEIVYPFDKWIKRIFEG